MIDITKNNLTSQASEYLLLSKDSPIHWQPWSSEIIDAAKKENKLIFISIGYLTCSWCKFMAHDAFQDGETIRYLNEHFIPVLIDREERPDIDQYCLFYAVETQHSAGWPLHAIFTPDFRPFVAFSYQPAKPTEGIPTTLLSVLQDSKKFFESHAQEIMPYMPPVIDPPPVNVEAIIPKFEQNFDQTNGGFDGTPKFPPHSSLIFLLHFFERTNHQSIFTIIKKTLDVMAMRGLHDHMRGGFFRYCLDAQWHIPHLEKVLYDQALLLWAYSLAFKTVKDPMYKTVAEEIMRCLDTDFADNGLYYTALDTELSKDMYLWTQEEIASALSEKEATDFLLTYELIDSPQHPEKKYLIKKRFGMLPDIENKLFSSRRNQCKPLINKKIITSYNALVGIGFCMAYRHLCIDNTRAKAESIFKNLIDQQKDGHLSHSSTNGTPQKEIFLQDYASLLLLATYLHEDTKNYEESILLLSNQLQMFVQNGIWFESVNTDFVPIPAQLVDHSEPSSVALAEFALWRAAFLLGKEPIPQKSYKEPLQLDFFNLAVFSSTGNFHCIDTPAILPWEHLPINSIQRRGSTFKDCFNNKCAEFNSQEELLNSLTR